MLTHNCIKLSSAVIMLAEFWRCWIQYCRRFRGQ